MPVDLVMPQLGLTMTEGKLLRWCKQVGQTFEAGEPLFEVETDKSNMEVEASEAGTLIEAMPPADDPLPVAHVIGRYLRRGESLETAAGALESPARVRRPASPRARAAARRLGVDLAAISAAGGRIVEADVLRAAEAQAPAVELPAPAGRTAPVPKLRRVIAERMTASFRTAPHFYVTREVDAGELLAVKRTYQAALEKRGLPALSLTDLLLKAMALAVRDHPAVNAGWVDGEIRPHRGVNIGLAVALEDGLTVPVLREVDRSEITELARRRQSLVERARASRLRPDDMGDAGATLSNLGMYGVDQFQAILNPPESVLVAAGRVRERVVAMKGAAVVRPTLFVTVTADHRVIDGVQAARFLASVAEALENPGLLLLPPENQAKS